jgi:hypothetical protein
LLIVLFLAVTTAANTRLCGDVITVCGQGCDYSSVNAAIDAASDGDVIQLRGEVYQEGETIVLQGKSLTIQGEVDAEGVPTTTLDGEGLHQVIRVEESAPVVLKDFAVTRGYSESNGGGLSLDGSSAVLQNLRVSECTAAGSGGGLRSIRSETELVGCVFFENTASGPGGGISVTENNTDLSASRFGCVGCNFICI